MRIDSSGRIGIGITSPVQILDIGSSGYAGIGFKSSRTTAADNIGGPVWRNNLNQEKAFIQSTVDGQLKFGAGGATERMRIDSSGRLLVNNTSATQNHPLQVRSSASTAEAILIIARASDNIGELSFFGSNNSTRQGEIQYRADHANIRHRSGDLRFAAGGTTERMRIDSSGRLLVGTTTYTGNGQVAIAGNSSGSSAAGCLDIRPTLSRPTAANTTLSLIRFGAADHSNNTGYASINVSSDGASSSESDLPGRLEFHTTPDGASAPTERMRIASDGNVLIGTTTGNNATGVGVKLRVNSTASVDLVFDRSDNVNLNHVYNMNATRNGYRYYLSLDGGIRNFSSNNVNLSDEREKKNIVDMNSTWSDLKQWTLRQFHFNDQNDSEDKRYGVIAQQIETVSPQVLSTFEIDPTTVRKGVKETQMMWMAIKALQEAQERIETLEANVAALEAQM